MDHHRVYMGHIEAPYGDEYAATVGRFQDGFIRDKVCRDIGSAFTRAVETAERLLPVIRVKATI